MEKQQRDSRVYNIAQNGIVAGLYYGLSLLCILAPVISQFGPIQCRISEIMVLLAFFKPRLSIGLTLGCFLTNVTGLAMGQSFPMDMLLGTLATLIACLLEAWCAPYLCIACLYPVLTNGLIVGAEIYWFFNNDNLSIFACMGFVALGELIAVTIGYIIFLFLMRNKGVMNLSALPVT